MTKRIDWVQSPVNTLQWKGISMDFKQIVSKIQSFLHTSYEKSRPYLQKLSAWRKRIWRKYHINKILILAVLLLVLVTSIYLFFVAKSTKVSELEAGLKESTIIYDYKGDEAGSLHSQKGNYVELSAISPYVVDALISTEDRRFYEHHGFDIKGIGRAFVRMLINRSTEGGGGSTITQQLAKNAYLTLDQTFNRKAKEIFLAIEIEKKYSKDEILTMYLNTSYFGNGVWGIQDAAKKYFGVDAKDLNLAESATLVGMLKGPSIYNPLDHLKNATNRRDTVLQLMVDNQKITKAAAQQAQQVNLAGLLNDTYTQDESDYQYPYYFDAVINEATSKYGLKLQDIMKNGYKIYTYLDQNYQRQMQSVYDENGYFPENAEDGTMVQSASIAVNPKNGGVEAVVGRRGEYTFLGYNFATQMKRSPGSTIKPLSVYAAALESGYQPSSLLKDEPLSFYDAKNYDGTYSGEVPLYQAVAQSLNLPAVWLLHEIGLDKGYKKAEEFGLSLDEKDRYWGLALGGLRYGESPQTMANAYAVFANGGTYYESHFIAKIIDATGAVIVDNTGKKGTRILSEKTTDEMNSILLGTFSNGTAVNAQPYGYQVAGKTGTTETNFDASKVNDQWIVGYTPDVVISTWLGYEETTNQHYLTSTSGQGVGQVFKAEAQGILPYTKNTSFNVVDAYQTDGKVMTPEQANSQNQTTEQEVKDKVNDFAQKAKEGLDDFGQKVKNGFDQLVGGLIDKIKGQ